MKFIEIFTANVGDMYGLDTSRTYFDCTNFYFEIDREDDFRRKWPSKEHRKGPIVGLGLLLDANQIPIGMDMYPGNESEQPVIRDVIENLKKRNSIVGKTIHVADKGLNCTKNIVSAKKTGDGYLFSKSVKTLPAYEINKAIEKVLMSAGYNLLVTSETRMKDEDIYNTYRNLWRIEESFKIMKSDLDARPVFVQKESTIKGHFLICYLFSP